MHHHAQCHEETFAAMASEVKKRSEQQTAIAGCMQTVHQRLDQLVNNISEQTSRIGRLEENGDVHHIKVEQVDSVVHILQEQQKHMKQFLRERLVELRMHLRQEMAMRKGERCSFEKDKTQVHELREPGTLNNLESLQASSQDEDYFKKKVESTLELSWSHEDSVNDYEKLGSLLQDLREESASVHEMLENVRQEKLEVVRAMHTFHLEKTSAMQEMEDFRQAAKEDFVACGSMRRRLRSEAHATNLPNTPFLPVPSKMVPTDGPSNQPTSAQVTPSVLPGCSQTSRSTSTLNESSQSVPPHFVERQCPDVCESKLQMRQLGSANAFNSKTVRRAATLLPVRPTINLRRLGTRKGQDD